MWQRIQTVFLVLVVLTILGAIFLPVWTSPDRSHFLYALQYTYFESKGVPTVIYLPYVITGILLVAAATIAVIQIGKYKDRILQIKLGALNSLLIALGLGSAVFFSSKLLQQYQGTFGFGLWLPAASALFNWLALRFIRKDEKLVRDSQRLR